MSQTSTSSLLITVKDVMQELGLGRSTVDKLIKDEGLPVVRFGRAIRINRRSLEQWLAEREAQRESQDV